MKKLLRIVVAIVVVLVVLIVAGLLMLDSLVKGGIETGGSSALGTQTRVEDVDVSLMAGRLTIDGLNVANVEGFQTPHLLKSGRFDLKLVPDSLLSDTVILQHFELDGLDINIEQKIGANNVSAILANLKRFGGKGDTSPQSDQGKKVRVDRILIRNVVAHVHLLPGVGKDRALTIRIPQVELTQVASDDAEGVVIGELIRRVLPAILTAVVEEGKGILPSDLADGLSGDLRAAAAAQLDKGIEDAGEHLKKGLDGTMDSLLGGKQEK